MEKLQAWAARFDAMSLRERLLIVVTAVVALAFPTFTYLIEPAQKETAKLTRSLQTLQAESAESRVEFELAKALKVKDPNVVLQQQIDSFKQQSEEYSQQLKAQSASLVEPREMVELLQQILKGHQGVKLVGAHKATPIRVDIAKADGEQATELGLFRHDLELVLEGGFFQVQGFLQAVEQSNKSLFWDSLDYQVGEYPNARVTLQVYTLSSTEEWLGV
ncbi:MAG: type II secretion system protein GspM [Halopseudomonas sp.]